MEKMELRTFVSDIAVEANESNSDELRIEGLVNGTETWSHVLGNKKKFVEKINKGVFFRALSQGGRFDFLGEHDRNLLLATTDNGSLELWEDEEGLKMRANIVPTSYGKDIYTLIRSKVINNMSFGFRVLKDSWKKGVDGIHERTIEDLELIEVSAVRNPAYPCSAISARNIEIVDDVEIPAEIEEEERMNPKDLEAIADMVVAKLAEKAPEPQQEVEPEVVEQVVEEVVEKPTEPEEATEEPVVDEPKEEQVDEVQEVQPEVEEPVQEEKIDEVQEEVVEPENVEPEKVEFDGDKALFELLKYQASIEEIEE